MIVENKEETNKVLLGLEWVINNLSNLKKLIEEVGVYDMHALWNGLDILGNRSMENDTELDKQRRKNYREMALELNNIYYRIAKCEDKNDGNLHQRTIKIWMDIKGYYENKKYVSGEENWGRYLELERVFKKELAELIFSILNTKDK